MSTICGKFGGIGKIRKNCEKSRMIEEEDCESITLIVACTSGHSKFIDVEPSVPNKISMSLQNLPCCIFVNQCNFATGLFNI